MNKIDWQTGVPLEYGVHIVTLSNGEVTTDIWLERSHRWFEYDDNLQQVIAWYPLKDVEPYSSQA